MSRKQRHAGREMPQVGAVRRIDAAAETHIHMHEEIAAVGQLFDAGVIHLARDRRVGLAVERDRIAVRGCETIGRAFARVRVGHGRGGIEIADGYRLHGEFLSRWFFLYCSKPRGKWQVYFVRKNPAQFGLRGMGV